MPNMEKVDDQIKESKDFFKLDLLQIKKVLNGMNRELRALDYGVEKFYAMQSYLVISKCWYDYGSRYSEFDLDHGQKHIQEMMIRSLNILCWYLKNKDFSELQKLGIKNINVLIYIVGVAAIFHDLYQEKDRRFHHELAAKEAEKITSNIRMDCDIIDGRLVYEYNTRKWDYRFRQPERSKLVALLCREHRASFSGEFSNVLCEIFSAADRDALDLKQIIQRSYSYTKKRREVQPRRNIIIEVGRTQFSIDKLMRDLIANDWEFDKVEVFYHIIDKFSKIGYMFDNIKPNGIFMEYYKNDIQNFWNEIDELILNPKLFDNYLN